MNNQNENYNLVVQAMREYSNEELEKNLSLNTLRFMHRCLDPKALLSQHKSIEIYCLRDLYNKIIRSKK